MPRELRPELTALIATGHCNWHTTIDVTLTGLAELHLSSGEIFINRFGINRQYLAKLRNIQSLDTSVEPEVDQIAFDVANVDMVMGQTLTGAERRLDGARAIVGTVFIDPNDTNIGAGQHIYDAKMPGELVVGEVSDENVAFTLLSDVDAVEIAGRTIASEFQWREPISVVPVTDPNDNGGHGTGDGLGCFVAGTMLKTPGGPQAIESFVVGAPIMVMDFTLGQLVESEVERIEVHENKLTRQLITGDGRKARLTDEQPIYIGKARYVRADKLIGLIAVGSNGKLADDRVASFDDGTIETVHHLHVKHPDHNYVLENGIIAHNVKVGRYGVTI